MKNFFEKTKEILKKIWKYLAVAFSIVFIAKIGGFLSKFRSSNKKEIKEIKKEIKEETKELGVKVEALLRVKSFTDEQEEKIKQSLVEKDSAVETLTEDNSNRKEELKSFLPDLD